MIVYSERWLSCMQEWPEEIYPPYANGPGYIISSDIAEYIVSQHANHTLRVCNTCCFYFILEITIFGETCHSPFTPTLQLFKMEDVSMGMWVEQFNSTKNVQYSHNWKYCQYGCMEDYHTAHYQSPRQMVCLWDNLMKGRPHCCNV